MDTGQQFARLALDAEVAQALAGIVVGDGPRKLAGHLGEPRLVGEELRQLAGTGGDR